MPGKRNLARERHAHDASLLLARHHALLTSQLAGLDAALVGQQTILRFFADFGVRRLNRGPLTWRIVNTWRVKHGCPILRGYKDGRATSGPFSTAFALTAWLLSRFTADDLFSVVCTLEVSHGGSFTRTRAA